MSQRHDRACPGHPSPQTAALVGRHRSGHDDGVAGDFHSALFSASQSRCLRDHQHVVFVTETSRRPHSVLKSFLVTMVTMVTMPFGAAVLPAMDETDETVIAKQKIDAEMAGNE